MMRHDTIAKWWLECLRTCVQWLVTCQGTCMVHAVATPIIIQALTIFRGTFTGQWSAIKYCKV